MRILLIANNFPEFADPTAGIFNLRSAQALRERGHEIRVLRFEPMAPPITKRWQRYSNVPSVYQVDGFSVRTVRGLVGPRGWGIGTLGRQLGRAVRDETARFNADIVHAHGLLHAGVLAAAQPAPYVVTAHGTETYDLPWRRPGLEKVARNVVGSASALTAVSQFCADHLQRLGAPTVQVIFNGADGNVFARNDRAEARKQFGFPANRSIVAFVGRIVREKGVLELIDAVSALRDFEPLLIIAGEGKDREGVENLARARKVDVRFLGSVEQAVLRDVYACADVVALPSYAEGLPTVLCEAMLMGRAIVASDVGGISEIVRDGETGFTIEPRNSAALAQALERVLVDAELRAKFEDCAYANAARELTWEYNARRYEATYREITERRSRNRERVAMLVEAARS